MTEARTPPTIEAPNVLLDGVYVQPSKVDPGKHRFIGLFRPPRNPFLGATTDCSCVFFGEQHYRNGCFDTPQYVSIQP